MASASSGRNTLFAKATTVAALLLAFVSGAWFQSSDLLDSLLPYATDIQRLSLQHLWLTCVSGGLAILLGVPIGILLARPNIGFLGHVVAQVVNLGTTIPTLAILAIAMTFLGLGAPPSIFALTFLTLLPIVLNTVAGIRSVPRSLIEAALGMGMTQGQILVSVKLPNALFVILAGVRTALAINIGTVPLAFLIGGGGLGDLIFTGIALMDTPMILAGTIPTALLAILIDFLISQIQYWLVPRGVNPLR